MFPFQVTKGFLTKVLSAFLIFSKYDTCSVHFFLFNHPNSIIWQEQIIEFFIR
jgi:hypothetical protein